MSNASKIAPGCRVSLRYALYLDDGTEVDSSGGESLTFVMGDGSLHSGLESVLLGLSAGDKDSFSIEPAQGFGLPDPDNVHVMPRDDFPDELDLTPGVVIGFSTPNGDEIPGTIVTVDEARVEVDFNHPLAGRTLRFDVDVITVEDSSS